MQTDIGQNLRDPAYTTAEIRIFKVFAGADLGGWLGWLVTPLPGAAAYLMLLLCVWIKLFRCRFVPLLEPNPDDATAVLIQVPKVTPPPI